MRVWLVTAVLLAMTLSPVLNPPAEYEDSAAVHRSNPPPSHAFIDLRLDDRWRRDHDFRNRIF